MSPEYTLRPVDPGDLSQVARVHIDSFPESALSKLGPVVVELYYRWQLEGPHRKVRAMAAFVGENCAGFSFSGIFAGSTSGFIRQYRRALAWAVLRRPRLVLDPLFLKRFREGARLLVRSSRRRRKPSAASTGVAKPNYGILAIAVAPQFRGSGIAQALMLDGETEALKYGCKEICLTVHPENDRAVRFYEALSWQRFISAGVWNGTMTKRLKVTH